MSRYLLLGYNSITGYFNLKPEKIQHSVCIVFCSVTPRSDAVKMETVGCSETLVSYHITTRRHNLEDHEFYLRCRENLKSCVVWCVDYK
jgi:hypothetical protein